jgi:hypothetical protein
MRESDDLANPDLRFLHPCGVHLVLPCVLDLREVVRAGQRTPVEAVEVVTGESPAQEARRLSEQATPGPWKRKRWQRTLIPKPKESRYIHVVQIGHYEPAVAEADAEFIARARTLLPDLAQQLEQDGLTIRDLQASEKHYHDLWKKAEQRIKELERALEIALSCVGNYAADSNLGEALAAVGINRHPEEDRDE